MLNILYKNYFKKQNDKNDCNEPAILFKLFVRSLQCVYSDKPVSR